MRDTLHVSYVGDRPSFGDGPNEDFEEGDPILAGRTPAEVVAAIAESRQFNGREARGAYAIRVADSVQLLAVWGLRPGGLQAEWTDSTVDHGPRG